MHAGAGRATARLGMQPAQGHLGGAGCAGGPLHSPRPPLSATKAAVCAGSSRLGKGAYEPAGDSAGGQPRPRAGWAEAERGPPTPSGCVQPLLGLQQQQQQQPQEQVCRNSAAAPSGSGGGGGSVQVCSAAFDDAGRVMREVALRVARCRPAPSLQQQQQVEQQQQQQPLLGIPAVPSASPSGRSLAYGALEAGPQARARTQVAAASAAHRRTSSNGSASSGGGSVFRISSSFRFLGRGGSCSVHEDSSHEADATDEAPTSCEQVESAGTCCWATASAGGVAGVGRGKRSPQQQHQQQQPLLSSPQTSPLAGCASAGGGAGHGAGAAAAGTPAAAGWTAGGLEAMQQSTGGGGKTGGPSLRGHGRAVCDSGASGASMGVRSPGACMCVWVC